MRKLMLVLFIFLLGIIPVTAQETSNLAANKALVQGLFDAYNTRDLPALNSLIAPDLLPTWQADLAAFWEAFPDAQYTVEQIIAEGNLVMARVTVNATHQGTWLTIPATFQPVAFSQMLLFRVEAGQIAEVWTTTGLELVEQLGTTATSSAEIAADAMAACRSETAVFTAPDGLGPYYIENAPLTDNIAPENLPGERLQVSGVVLNARCEPLVEAVVDVWQTDANGVYDFSDQFILRGRIQADENGYYQFKTIVPGVYESRPSHIHVLVSHPDLPQPFVTQIYFVDDPRGANLPNAIATTPDENGLLQGVFNIFIGS